VVLGDITMWYLVISPVFFQKTPAKSLLIVQVFVFIVFYLACLFGMTLVIHKVKVYGEVYTKYDYILWLGIIPP
jgi:hypothetical protein